MTEIHSVYLGCMLGRFGKLGSPVFGIVGSVGKDIPGMPSPGRARERGYVR